MNKQKGESQARSLVKFFCFCISSDIMGAIIPIFLNCVKAYSHRLLLIFQFLVEYGVLFLSFSKVKVVITLLEFGILII